MITPGPTPTPDWTPPPELPDWFVRTANDPGAAQHLLTEAMFWVLVTFVLVRFLMMLVADFWPIRASPEGSRRARKAISVVLIAVMLAAIGYLSWILVVLVRSA